MLTSQAPDSVALSSSHLRGCGLHLPPLLDCRLLGADTNGQFSS